MAAAGVGIGAVPATAAGLPGIDHLVVREALAAKAVGGIAGAGKGAAMAGQAGGGSAGAAQALATGGTLWSGKGFSLGLGIGLGVWGPILVGVAGAVAAYAYLQYQRRDQEDGTVETAAPAPDEGFLAAKS